MVKLALAVFVLPVYANIRLHKTVRGKFLNVNYICIGFKSALYYQKREE